MTFTYGAAIPILFPIAFLSLSFLYITERFLIFYSYREPPMYSTKSNLMALKVMMYAPIIYCINAAWLFSN